MENIAEGIIWSLWKIKEIGWLELPTNGASGDIVLFWNEDFLGRMQTLVGECTIPCLFDDRRSDTKWDFIRVYNRGEERERRILWKDL